MESPRFQTKLIVNKKNRENKWCAKYSIAKFLDYNTQYKFYSMVKNV